MPSTTQAVLFISARSGCGIHHHDDDDVVEECRRYRETCGRSRILSVAAVVLLR